MSIIQLVIPRLFPNDQIVLMNNIFGTLFLSVLSMYAADKIIQGRKNKDFQSLVKGVSLFIAIIVYGIVGMLVFSNTSLMKFSVYFVMLIPNIFFVEGSFLFVILGLAFYLFREHRLLQVISLGIIALISTSFNFTELFTSNIQWMMIFSSLPILLYNGQEGRKMKWFFYIFYPAHIVILYILATMLFA